MQWKKRLIAFVMHKCEGRMNILGKDKRIDYFHFEYRKYAKGTIAKFKEGYYGYYNGCGYFQFYDLETKKLGPCCNDADYCQNKIESIIYPVYYTKPQYVKVIKDTDNSDIFYAWIAYVVLMIVATIFNGRILAWIALSIWFWTYRHKKLYDLKTYVEKDKGGK